MENRQSTDLFKSIIKKRRETHRLTQAEMADILGISRTYLSRIESGSAVNLSFALATRILNFGVPDHKKIQVTLPRKVWIDAGIATEIVWLNSQGVVTESSCQGPPSTALIRPSSIQRAKELGYSSEYQSDIGFFLIHLKSIVDVTGAGPAPAPKEHVSDCPFSSGRDQVDREPA